MNVYVAGRKVVPDPARAVGKGGEADVYDIGGGRALKLFKGPDHPDLSGDAGQQEAARERLEEHQRKLRHFPASLPPRVVAPEDLATTRDGRRILGYTMRLLDGADPLLRYSSREFREAGVEGARVLEVFHDLHATLAGLHRAGVVVGDFTDLNVLVRGAEAHVIDADSFQFGSFPCRLYSQRFVDPRLCDPSAAWLVLARPHDRDSDWYAYAVMLLRSLLYVDPYGGVFQPRQAPRVPAAARPLHRITVFHPEVRYPRPALLPDVLPDDLVHHFHCVFVRDRRGEFPLALLDGLRWTRCDACGTEHARESCPSCRHSTSGALPEAIRVRGQVTATDVFSTPGTILAAALDGGSLRVLVHEDGRFRREDGTVVLEGELHPRTQYRLSGRRTLVGRDASLAVLAPGRPPTRFTVDGPSSAPAAFDANAGHAYWVAGGRLLRDGELGPERIGDVLAGQTRIWAGPAFGFGFYRAGGVHVSFVFDARRRGLNDGVRVPPLPGELIDAECAFAGERCWFLASMRHGGRTLHRCLVVRRDGSLEAAAEGYEGDGTWLSSIHGKCAAGDFLFSATDRGLVRVEPRAGAIVPFREFPETEPFVDEGSRLLAGPDGLYVVGRREIRRLSIG
jgi:hypothetical protein